MAKKGQKQKRYSAEFQIGVIMDMQEHHLGYCKTAGKYNLVKETVWITALWKTSLAD